MKIRDVRDPTNKTDLDVFEILLRPWRFLAQDDRLLSFFLGKRDHAYEEFKSYFPPVSPDYPLEMRYRLVMASAMFETPGCFLYRCPACRKLTPVYFGKPSPGWHRHNDGPWTRYRPWETNSGTICLWCHVTIWRGWLTGRRFVHRDEPTDSVSEEIMRRAVGIA